MNRVTVVSENIYSIGYDPSKKCLEVEFRPDTQGNFRVFRYGGVSADVHKQFMEAESKGSFLHTHIKGKYAEMEVTPVAFRVEVTRRIVTVYAVDAQDEHEATQKALGGGGNCTIVEERIESEELGRIERELE